MSTSLDDEAQQDEMLAMESIFDQETFQIYTGEIISGQIKVRVDLPEHFWVVLEATPAPGDAVFFIQDLTQGAELRYRVEHMPPLTLHFTLPKSYPSQTKPNFTLSAVWLHRAALSILCQKLDELWDENKGMGILFTWSNFLQAKSLLSLGIRDVYDIVWKLKPQHLSMKNPFIRAVRKRPVTQDLNLIAQKCVPYVYTPHGFEDLADDVAKEEEVEEAEANTSQVQPGEGGRNKKRGAASKAKKPKFALDQRAASDPVPRKDGKDVPLVDYLLFYNDEQVREAFKQSTHSCDICFSIKLGNTCVRFRCGHVFCEDCVSKFFTTNITEGNVDQVKCLAFNCRMKPTPDLVKQLLGNDLYERYDEILLKRALENMSDVTYCPRPKCHNPVLCDPNDKCASCTLCGYTFCNTCKMVYHGVEPCRFKDADMKEVFKQYTEGSASEKKALVKAYGEKQLKLLVENVLSERWIQQESKPCPHCKVPIEKFEGCNKVTCYKCNTYFCWICLKQLEQGNPYFHFNDPSSKCYNNLFQDVNGDDPGNDWFRPAEDDDDDDDEIDTESSGDDDDDDYNDDDFGARVWDPYVV